MTKFTNKQDEVAARKKAFEQAIMGVTEITAEEEAQARCEAAVESLQTLAEAIPDASENPNGAKAKAMFQVLSKMAESLAYLETETLTAMAENPSELLSAVTDNYGYRLTNNAEVPESVLNFTDYAESHSADLGELYSPDADMIASLDYLGRDSLVALVVGFERKYKYAIWG